MESGGSKGESKTTGKRKASDLNQKSLAEFFAENTNIAGFDDPGKSLYSTVRELVENALDSAESIQELPLVEVTIEELNRSKLNSMIDDDFDTLKDSTIRNIPHIHLHEKIGGNENWHGAEIKVVIDGNWKTYGSKILEYMRQMAVITPYAEFKFRFVAVTPNENGVVEKSYSRLTEEMPPVPVETKYHPSAVDSLHIIQRLIGQTKNQNLLDFLQHEFVNIPKAQAKRLIAKMAPDVTSETQVNSLTLQQIACMNQLFQHTKFDDPSGNCLAPLGDESFCEGIYKVLQPKMVATYTAKSAQVYQGHPFIVEAGVSMGGKCFKQGINIFLFANRVPLLFEQDADVVTTTATKRIKWERYKIFKRQEKIGVFVNIVSTKIPFKGSGMAKAVKANNNNVLYVIF
ncbi:DNA topoisomerase 6 subunit B [Lactuca sativa]|uniref:DNA topoisomerase 6 subunit B n=1 Tax=Lactuca sativa TaxID=4236 RepID=UPI0022B065AA|nr:DNA topoisomerase 6 subunit B [Lactuca sativa]